MPKSSDSAKPIAQGHLMHNGLHLERRRSVRPVAAPGGHAIDQAEQLVSYKIALDTSELEQAYRLVWDAYVDTGLQTAGGSPLRITRFHLLPTTKTFVAIGCSTDTADGRLLQPWHVIGTITLVLDSELGLPLDEVCGERIDALRAKGERFAEVIAFAVDPRFRQRNIMLRLFRLLFEYALLKNVDRLLGSITERHIGFYRRMLFFQPIGELRPYSAANGQYVQCHFLPVKSAKRVEQSFRLLDFDCDFEEYFFKPNAAGQIPDTTSPWTPHVLRHFFSEKPELIDDFRDGTFEKMHREYAARGLWFPASMDELRDFGNSA